MLYCLLKLSILQWLSFNFFVQRLRGLRTHTAFESLLVILVSVCALRLPVSVLVQDRGPASPSPYKAT